MYGLIGFRCADTSTLNVTLGGCAPIVATKSAHAVADAAKIARRAGSLIAIMVRSQSCNWLRFLSAALCRMRIMACFVDAVVWNSYCRACATVSAFRALSNACCVAAIIVGGGTALAQVRSSIYVTGLSLPVEFVQDPTDPSVQ